jgi:hypothetical protein
MPQVVEVRGQHKDLCFKTNTTRRVDPRRGGAVATDNDAMKALQRGFA